MLLILQTLWAERLSDCHHPCRAEGWLHSESVFSNDVICLTSIETRPHYDVLDTVSSWFLSELIFALTSFSGYQSLNVVFKSFVITRWISFIFFEILSVFSTLSVVFFSIQDTFWVHLYPFIFSAFCQMHVESIIYRNQVHFIT